MGDHTGGRRPYCIPGRNQRSHNMPKGVPNDQLQRRGDQTAVQATRLQSRRPVVLSNDQLCCPTTSCVCQRPYGLQEGPLWSKYCHTTQWEAYKHTSTSTLRQVLGLHDHSGFHTTESAYHATSVDSHDQCGLTRPYVEIHMTTHC